MDATTAQLSAFACSLTYEDLPKEVTHQVKRTLIDAFACSLGGFGSDVAGLSRRMAARVSSASPASVIGTTMSSTPDMAAFANAVMMRCLDCNDVYFSDRGNGTHPSDMIPGILAAAEALGSDGPAIMTSIVTAYEVVCRLSDAAPFHNLGGWDYGTFNVVGTACGAAKIMQLDQPAMAAALSLAVVANVALGATREGALSKWKGCASAYATKNGLFAAELAREGMTGPSEPFDGPKGLWDQVAGCPVVLEPLDTPSHQPFHICRTSFKTFPAQSHTQGPTGLALELRPHIVVSEILQIRITTYGAAVRYGSEGPARWRPDTRETADHSIPYLVATALLDGDVTPHSFTRANRDRGEVRNLIDTMVVEESDDFTAAFPAEEHCRMEVTLRSGQRLTSEVVHPKGHWKNPLTDDEIEDKLHRLGSQLPESARRELLNRLWTLEEVATVGPLFEILAGVQPAK
jgi:2-methylcitrate dehydratase